MSKAKELLKTMESQDAFGNDDPEANSTNKPKPGHENPNYTSHAEDDEENPLDELQQYQQLVAKIDRKPVATRVDLYSTLTGKLFGELLNTPSGKTKILKLIKEYRAENKI